MTLKFWQILVCIGIYFSVCLWNASKPDWTEIRDLIWASGITGAVSAAVSVGAKKVRARTSLPPPQEDIRASAKGGSA